MPAQQAQDLTPRLRLNQLGRACSSGNGMVLSTALSPGRSLHVVMGSSAGSPGGLPCHFDLNRQACRYDLQQTQRQRWS
ncbi:hypothetical protein BBFGKLBO_02151 [Synechococcus sp. CBW1107]|nr:hypothetical protein BBFGKLBO_02151 [Synechococcus sp. CBW1107]